MDWNKLRIFHAVAEAGSFTRATEVLNMSQPAISRQISNLELDLEVTLFRRHARGLILTEQGELLFKIADDIAHQLRDVKNILSDSSDEPLGDLCVTTTVGLGSTWLTPRLSEFSANYPGIKLRLILEDNEMDIIKGQADVAIRLHEPTQNGLVRLKLFTVHLHAYASQDYVNKRGMIHTTDELEQHDILSFEGNIHPFQELNWLEHTNMRGKKRDTILTVNNLFALTQAVSTGMGVAILPDYMVRQDKNIVRVLKDADVPELSTYFVYPEELRNSRRLKVFKEFVVAKAKEWSF